MHAVVNLATQLACLTGDADPQYPRGVAGCQTGLRAT